MAQRWRARTGMRTSAEACDLAFAACVGAVFVPLFLALFVLLLGAVAGLLFFFFIAVGVWFAASRCADWLGGAPHSE